MFKAVDERQYVMWNHLPEQIFLAAYFQDEWKNIGEPFNYELDVDGESLQYGVAQNKWKTALVWHFSGKCMYQPWHFLDLDTCQTKCWLNCHDARPEVTRSFVEWHQSFSELWEDAMRWSCKQAKQCVKTCTKHLANKRDYNNLLLRENVAKWMHDKARTLS